MRPSALLSELAEHYGFQHMSFLRSIGPAVTASAR
jgi:hypothetical protein